MGNRLSDMCFNPSYDLFEYEDLVGGLKQAKFKRIVILTGAGISVSAGIPDFRSPGSGLYSNLSKYKLPSPEAIFRLSYFQQHPEAFNDLASTFIDLDQYQPTPTHYFCKMLIDRRVVLQYLTQNIDNLEAKAGISPTKYV